MLVGSGQQTASIATKAAGEATTAAVTAHLIPAAAAGPIGLAIAGVGLALAAIFSRKGPAQKIVSTRIVDQLEPQLRANLAAYMAGPRTSADRAAALANFDEAWAFLASSEACGNPDLGNPGRACIQDRAPGGKWDWFAMYRDPIAADSPSAGLIGAIQENWVPIALVAAAVLL